MATLPQGEDLRNKQSAPVEVTDCWKSQDIGTLLDIRTLLDIGTLLDIRTLLAKKQARKKVICPTRKKIYRGFL